MAPSPFATPWERFTARLPVGLRRKVQQLSQNLSALLSPPRAVPSRPTTTPGRSWQDQNVDLDEPVPAPSPISPISSVPASTSAVLHTRQVRVAEVVRETADAVTLIFEDPSRVPFHFKPGQFFTLLVDIDGESVRRAYSASSVPRDSAKLALTIKRVAGGLCSNFVNDRVRAGTLIELLGPSGNFAVDIDAGAERELVLVAGGSGITPMMSIARTVLAEEPHSRVTLLYGNRGEADIIFAKALASLAEAHPERLRIRHVLQTPPAGWAGGTGLLDEATTRSELAALAPSASAHYYVCGPEPMMAAARTVLVGLGVPAERLHEERFSQPHRRPQRVEGEAGAAQPLVVEQKGRHIGAISIPAGKTLLETGLGAGLPMPFSCAMGGCGECMVKLVDGQVEMEEPNCLLPEERAKGFILACVSRPLSPCKVELP